MLTLQARLRDLGYMILSVDGVFGDETAHAVVAFQKVNGIARDGIVGPVTLHALARPTIPRGRYGGEGPHVEVDLTRQVVLVVRDRSVERILDASTGSGLYYSQNGRSGIAITPTGSFRVEWTIDAWHESPLGLMYRPLFFHDGYAIHGSTSVPPYPASHGCVRLTIEEIDYLFPLSPVGTSVYVY